VTLPSSSGPGAGLSWRWLGRLEYGAALALQDELVRDHAHHGDTLLLLEHDPVYTTGRGGDEANLPRRGPGPAIPVFRVGRGGDATYHGPGQLVGYPIVDLRARGGDVHRFLRDVEAVLIATLRNFDVSGFAFPGRTGVWVDRGDPRKVASVGIGVRRGISSHGFALNVALDLGPFDAIVPCAIRGVRMTSIERERTAPPPGVRDVAEVAAAHFRERFALARDVDHQVGSRRAADGFDSGKSCSDGF
jgi:lipoyl(octanoyl) transferase